MESIAIHSLFSTIETTLILLLTTICLSLIWSLPTAFLCRFYRFRGSFIWQYLLILPIAVPSYLNSFIFSDLFYFSGFVYLWIQDVLGITIPFNLHSTFGASLILSLSLFPYIFFPLYMRLGSLPQNLFDLLALQSDSRLKYFLNIGVPFSLPVIVFSSSLIGMETLADFGTTAFFGVNSLSVFIFNIWHQTSNSIFAVKMSFIFVLFIGSLTLIEYIARPLKHIIGGYNIGDVYTDKKRVYGLKAILCHVLCSIPFILGFLLPVSYFIVNTFLAHVEELKTALFVLWETFYPAFFTAILCVTFSLVLVFWQKVQSINFFSKIFIIILTYGYAVPGIILGLFVLIAVNMIDHTLGNAMVEIGFMQPHTIISGGMFALILAYILRFLTVSYGNIKTASDQLSFSLFETMILMGHNNIGIFKELFIKLLKKPIFIAFILVFIDVVKELPITLLLRPFGFETLATYSYNMAGLEQISEASPAALLIIIFGIGACIIPFIAIQSEKNPA